MAHYPTSISAQTMVGIQSPPSLTISGTNGYNNYNNYNTISTQGINNTLTTFFVVAFIQHILIFSYLILFKKIIKFSHFIFIIKFPFLKK